MPEKGGISYKDQFLTHEGRKEAKEKLSAVRKPIARRVERVERAQEKDLGISFDEGRDMEYTCVEDGCNEKATSNKGLGMRCPPHREAYIAKRRETDPNFAKAGPRKKKQKESGTEIFAFGRKEPVLTLPPAPAAEKNGNLDAMAARYQAIADILIERERQDVLKAQGRFKFTLADDGLDDMEKMYTILEEIAEAGKEVMAMRGNITDGEGTNEALRKEVVQIAALSLAWLEVL